MDLKYDTFTDIVGKHLESTHESREHAVRRWQPNCFSRDLLSATQGTLKT